jgi:hypothetical protein
MTTKPRDRPDECPHCRYPLDQCDCAEQAPMGGVFSIDGAAINDLVGRARKLLSGQGLVVIEPKDGRIEIRILT